MAAEPDAAPRHLPATPKHLPAARRRQLAVVKAVAGGADAA